MEEFDVRSLYVLTGLVVGCFYGSFAQATAFCIRRGISDLAEGKGGATLTGWFGALLVALPMTQWMIVDGHLDSSQTVYFPEALSWWTTLIGAIAFGIGMMLTRGCPARLLVLGATGNLRAWFGLLVIGVSGYATFKGLIAELRVELQQIATLELPMDSVLLLIPGIGMASDCAYDCCLRFFCSASWVESQPGGWTSGRFSGCWGMVHDFSAWVR